MIETPSVDVTQISIEKPCLLIQRMFLLQQSENHTQESEASKIKNVAERFTKVGKERAGFSSVA